MALRYRRLGTVPLLAVFAMFLLPSAVRPLAAQETDAAEEPAAQEEPVAQTDTSADVEAATETAMAWLELVDAGEYEESWKQAASAFQDAVTPSVWRTSVEDARGPYEPFGERTLAGTQQMSDPPGAPPGDYVILQYRTEVAGDHTVTETVVPMKEGDAWKVSGYFVQPQ